jgi:hypothetical protein
MPSPSLPTLGFKQLNKTLSQADAAQALAGMSQEDLLTLRGRLKESLALYYFLARNSFAFLGLASLAVASLVAVPVIRDGGVWESVLLSFCMVFVGTYVIFAIGAVAAVSGAQVHEKWLETQFKPLNQLLGGCTEARGLIENNACCASYHAAVLRSSRELVIADLSMMRSLISLERRHAEEQACKDLHGFAV